MNPFSDMNYYFKSPLQEFVFIDKYSRYNYKLGRRESWRETVDRAVNYLKKLSEYKLPDNIYKKIHQYILELKVMPSMRLLAMAGPAAERNNLSIYNCSFIGVNSIDAFVEALLISMAGCGVGFSVEKKYVNQLPQVPTYHYYHRTKYIIEDTTEGWGEALRVHLYGLFGIGCGYDVGEVIEFDYSKIRPAGSPLKIKGGTASGPEPLKETFDFITSVFQKAQGRMLRPIELHDIMCSIGQCSIAGGMRRTAMISLFDHNDKNMLKSKTGKYNNYRWNANNSMVWPINGLDKVAFNNFFDILFDGMTGEPGIYSLQSAQLNAPTRRNGSLIVGVNPCFANGTLINTRAGIYPVESLLNNDTEIWNGNEWELTKFEITGENQSTLNIEMQDGSELIVTPYHRLILDDNTTIQAKDLQIGNRLKVSNTPYLFGNKVKAAYFKGFLAGDGTSHKGRPALYLYFPKWMCESRLIQSVEELDDLTINTNSIKTIEFVPDSDIRKRITGITVRKDTLIDYVNRYVFPQEIFK
ncbi:MAG: hypothetical protein HC874_32125 [Richelia sp. SL_2_1]|nr:hypothetical protein [Richelia sp. SL_2_1]